MERHHRQPCSRSSCQPARARRAHRGRPWYSATASSTATSRTARRSRTASEARTPRGRRQPAQHPGDGLGLPRRRGQRHRRQTARRRALRHHDPAARLGRPEGRRTASASRATRWWTGPTASVDGETIPGEDRGDVQQGVRRRRPAVHGPDVEELTGIYIDHFVVVDFNGFKDMVDAVNGVEVCIPEDVDDDRAQHPLRGRHPGARRAGRRSTTCASATCSRSPATSAG